MSLPEAIVDAITEGVEQALIHERESGIPAPYQMPPSLASQIIPEDRPSWKASLDRMWEKELHSQRRKSRMQRIKSPILRMLLGMDPKSS